MWNNRILRGGETLVFSLVCLWRLCTGRVAGGVSLAERRFRGIVSSRHVVRAGRGQGWGWGGEILLTPAPVAVAVRPDDAPSGRPPTDAPSSLQIVSPAFRR